MSIKDVEIDIVLSRDGNFPDPTLRSLFPNKSSYMMAEWC